MSGSRDIFINSSICPGAATPAHAIFHALGRWHEQSRYDRDQFVNIHSENFDNTSKSLLWLIKLIYIHNMKNIPVTMCLRFDVKHVILK